VGKFLGSPLKKLEYGVKMDRRIVVVSIGRILVLVTVNLGILIWTANKSELNF
jgi:hypothetical protein